eukprot:UN02861
MGLRTFFIKFAIKFTYLAELINYLLLGIIYVAEYMQYYGLIGIEWKGFGLLASSPNYQTVREPVIRYNNVLQCTCNYENNSGHSCDQETIFTQFFYHPTQHSTDTDSTEYKRTREQLKLYSENVYENDKFLATKYEDKSDKTKKVYNRKAILHKHELLLQINRDIYQ